MAEREAKAKEEVRTEPKPATVTFVSAYPLLRVCAVARDSHWETIQGVPQQVVKEPGHTVAFQDSRAKVPARIAEIMRAMPDYGRTFVELSRLNEMLRDPKTRRAGERFLAQADRRRKLAHLPPLNSAPPQVAEMVEG